MRSAKLNEKTRLKLIVQPGHRFNLQSYPYLYRVGLETIINDYPSHIYVSEWTDNIEEVNSDFDRLLGALEATEEET